MVEKTIRESKEHPTKMILWRSLPKKTMYQTLLLILNYLEESGKIVIKDKRIIWIYDAELNKWLENRKLIAR
jgi:outer membrane lipoprotein-sorting protein